MRASDVLHSRRDFSSAGASLLVTNQAVAQVGARIAPSLPEPRRGDAVNKTQIFNTSIF